METAVIDLEVKSTVNDKIFRSVIPAAVYVTVLMVLGLVGNVMVCIYYGRHAKTTTNIFIIVLTIYDLLNCIISMPAEIVDLRFFYGNVFTYEFSCKVLRFENFFSAFGSVFTLLVIAADRYSRICRFKQRQLTLKNAKVLCIVVALAAVIVSWPSLVFYQPVEAIISETYNTTVYASRCQPSPDYGVYIKAFNISHFIIFGVSTIVLGVVYTVVCYRMYKHVKNQANRRSQFTLLDLSAASPSTPDSVVKTGFSYTNTNNRKVKAKTMELGSVKYTVIMIAVTVLFIISYLPYLYLKLWTAYGKTELALTDHAAFRIGIRSFFINSAANPIIYGFLNSNFRQYFKQKLCLRCCKDGNDSSTSSPPSC